MRPTELVLLIILALGCFVYLAWLFQPIPKPPIIQPVMDSSSMATVQPSSCAYADNTCTDNAYNTSYIYNNVMNSYSYSKIEFNNDGVECSIDGDGIKWHATKISGQYLCDINDYKIMKDFQLGLNLSQKH